MKPKFIIEDQIVKATKKCEKNFSCLKLDESAMCKVVFCINCKLHGIECKNDTFCAYKLTAEERNFCTCPTRKEIYFKYKV
jgi:hypothetical protein